MNELQKRLINNGYYIALWRGRLQKASEVRIQAFLPLILIETYLVATLALLKFGPVHWRIANEALFWAYIGAYHLAFIIGYWIALMKISAKRGQSNEFFASPLRFNVVFSTYLVLAFVGSLIAYRNLVHSKSYVPVSFFSDFYKGMIHPAASYYYKLGDDAARNFTGNLPVTALYGLIAFARFSLIPVMVFLWPRITKLQKFFGLCIAFIYFASGVTVGTNKPIFDTLFMFLGALLIETVVNFRKSGFASLGKRKGIVAIIFALVIFAPVYFQYGLKERVGAADYFESIGKRGDIVVNPSGKGHFLATSLSSYIDQGYYGMALAISQPFSSTYGIGNSNFLLLSFKKYLNIDLNPRTYQFKIDKQWSQFGQWHSFYSQWANDLGFGGVIGLMLVLGMIVATVWKDAIENGNLIAKCLLVLFIIMFLYMPANNQLFNMMESLFSFWEIAIAWIVGFIIARRARSAR